VEPLLNIVYEDAELLVVNKPAGLVCHPTKGDAWSSLISRVRLHLGESIPGHLVNRLDRETSGIVLVAKGDRRAGNLKQLFAEREVTKEYLAIVHGHVAADTGACEAPLGRDETSVVAVKDCVRPDGSAARTEFRVEQRFTAAVPSAEPSTLVTAPFTSLRVFPHTGRKHQIRIHLAHLGHPIVGDKIYGGDERLYLDFVERRLTESQRRQLILPCQALHAERLRFNWLQRDWDFHAPPESWFTDFIAGQPCPPDWAERYR
jgi:23S rRNA pseudouridine1911/1915/1917 synthase